MNRHADWLLEDLEARRRTLDELTAKADTVGDWKLAHAYRIRRDVWDEALAIVRAALPKIVAETPEPDISVVFGPLASHSETLA
jgi:hypothetical protein